MKHLNHPKIIISSPQRQQHQQVFLPIPTLKKAQKYMTQKMTSQNQKMSKQKESPKMKLTRNHRQVIIRVKLQQHIFH